MRKNGFCIKNRIIPSVFVIGIQKCGTSTLDEVLSQFPKLSHGSKKEHQYFDESREPYSEYLKQFPKCSNSLLRTHDATPGYTNPLSNAPMNISRFYNFFGIPPKKLIFIAMVCSNTRRIPSIFYHHRRHNRMKRNTKLNAWFDMSLKSHNSGVKNPMDKFDANYDLSRMALSMGLYDSIFKTYFELFNESKFLLIDSDYAFIDMQNLGDFLANEMNLSKQKIRYVHSNSHESKSNNGKVQGLSHKNSERLKEFYLLHERNFKEIVKTNINVKVYPTDNFLDNWT